MKPFTTAHYRMLVLALLFLLLAACRQEQPPPEDVVLPPTATATAPATATNTPSPEPSSTPLPPTDTAVPTATLPPTATPTVGPTAIPFVVVQVTDTESGNPITGATVALFIPNLNFSVTEETGEDGTVTINNLAAGTYPLTVSAPTYGEITQEVQVGGGENLVPVTLQRLPPPEVFGVVNADRTNLRTGPGSSFSSLRKLSFGESVQVIGRTPDQLWLLVTTSDSLEGWVGSSLVDTDQPVEIVYVATPAPTVTPTPLPLIQGTTVIDAKLRLRPGPEEAVLADLPAGTQLQVIAQTADQNWLLVRTAEGLEGWIFFSLVELDASQDLIPGFTPTPIPGITPEPGGEGTPQPPPPPPGGNATVVPTPVPGVVPTSAPFNPIALRDSMTYLDLYIIDIGGALDRLLVSGVNQADCDNFLLNYGYVLGSASYSNVPETWLGIYGAYQASIAEVLNTSEAIALACTQAGTITQLNYSVARDAVNNSHDRLVAAIALANQLLGQ